MTAASDVRVDPANREQLRAWDGDEGAYWAEHADYFDRSVVAYHQRLLDAASIADTERVLDVGCGSGQTTATPPAPLPEERHWASISRRGCSSMPVCAPPTKV